MQWFTNLILELLRPLLIGGWHLSGWRCSRPLPDVPKVIITAAPHTSNWDYPMALFAAYEQRRRLRVTTKKELFFFPLNLILRALGCIPIDRNASHNIVEQIAARLKEADRMAIIFTPEGTRGYTEYWKTGFYWAALEADVPIACATINYRDKCVYFELVFMPTGDLEADFEKIRAVQEQYGYGLHPDKTSKLALKPHDPAPSKEEIVA